MMSWKRSWKYTDKAFLHWIRQQPSCLSGNFSEYVNGKGMCIAAHVRSSSNSGTGFKPEFSAIPLTDEEHRIQHNKGEMECLNIYRPDLDMADKKEAHKWFVDKAAEYVEKWRKTL